MGVLSQRPARPVAVILPVDVPDGDAADPLVVGEERVHLGRRLDVVEVVDSQVSVIHSPGADVFVDEFAVELDLTARRHDRIAGLSDELAGVLRDGTWRSK